jgi:hypothetical protein
METLQLKLKQNINVDPKYGMVAGEVFEVIDFKPEGFDAKLQLPTQDRFQVMSKKGFTVVAIFPWEALALCPKCQDWQRVDVTLKNVPVCHSCNTKLWQV